MKNYELEKILGDYTLGKADVEATNKELERIDSGLRVDPDKNTITEAEKHQTVIGYYPEQTTGYGLLDTGTGSLDKVHVTGGKLDDCDMGESFALVIIAGRMYEVDGRALKDAD